MVGSCHIYISRMAHKTKKQKVKAIQHRQHKETVVSAPSSVPISTGHQPSSTPVFSFKRTAASQIKTHSTAGDLDAFVYLRRDLMKTVVLAVICCGVIIGLSFVMK